jgi:hypothetical protein
VSRQGGADQLDPLEQLRTRRRLSTAHAMVLRVQTSIPLRSVTASARASRHAHPRRRWTSPSSSGRSYPKSRRSRFADDDRFRRCSAASSPCGGSASANTASWISRTARHPRADGIASFEQTLVSAHGPGGRISRRPRGCRGSQGKQLGVVLGSLGRGMQADGVWDHLPATTGPIAAVPARGCPHRVATRPGAQSAQGAPGYP